MAWYAELKRRKQWAIFGIYMNHWYSDKLYQDWYNSLTPEQLERLKEFRKEQSEKHDRELKQACMNLLSMACAVGSAFSRRV